MYLLPSKQHHVQLRQFFVARISAARASKFDSSIGLFVPPYEIEAQTLERPVPETLVASYRVFTPSLERQLASNKNAFCFDITVICEFSIAPEMPEGQVEPFIRAGGLIVMWPFLRQTVADLSMRLGFPPLLLPLLTVPVVSATVDNAGPSERSPTTYQ